MFVRGIFFVNIFSSPFKLPIKCTTIRKENKQNDKETSFKGHHRYLRTVSLLSTSPSQSSLPPRRAIHPESSPSLLQIPRPRVNSLSPCDNVIPRDMKQYKEECGWENESYDEGHYCG